MAVEGSKTSTFDSETVGSANKDDHGTGTTTNHTGSSRDLTAKSLPFNLPQSQGDHRKSTPEDIPQHVQEGSTTTSLTRASTHESNNLHDKKHIVGGFDKGKSDRNPYLNKTVRVVRGQFEG